MTNWGGEGQLSSNWNGDLKRRNKSLSRRTLNFQEPNIDSLDLGEILEGFDWQIGAANIGISSVERHVKILRNSFGLVHHFLPLSPHERSKLFILCAHHSPLILHHASDLLGFHKTAGFRALIWAFWYCDDVEEGNKQTAPNSSLLAKFWNCHLGHLARPAFRCRLKDEFTLYYWLRDLIHWIDLSSHWFAIITLNLRSSLSYFWTHHIVLIYEILLWFINS